MIAIRKTIYESRKILLVFKKMVMRTPKYYIFPLTRKWVNPPLQQLTDSIKRLGLRGQLILPFFRLKIFDINYE
jgi:hypothetical protein